MSSFSSFFFGYFLVHLPSIYLTFSIGSRSGISLDGLNHFLWFSGHLKRHFFVVGIEDILLGVFSGLKGFLVLIFGRFFGDFRLNFRPLLPPFFLEHFFSLFWFIFWVDFDAIAGWTIRRISRPTFGNLARHFWGGSDAIFPHPLPSFNSIVSIDSLHSSNGYPSIFLSPSTVRLESQSPAVLYFFFH